MEKSHIYERGIKMSNMNNYSKMYKHILKINKDYKKRLKEIVRLYSFNNMFLNDIPSRKYYADTEMSVRYAFISIIFTAKAVLDTAENVEDLTMDELKERGMWFACADMDGEVIYRQNLTGSIGLVIGNEGSGVSRLVKEKCDFISSIPMKGDIDSLNASVAAGVLAFEVVRQRLGK